MEESSYQHWPAITERRMDCIVCHTHTKKTHWIQTKCEKCNVGLCISGCFQRVLHKGTALGGKLWQEVIGGDSCLQRTSTGKVYNN
jgi:hypothetical protein